MPGLTFNTYGKSDVRLTQVLRDGEQHEVVELSVKILFQGDFAESYTRADNSKVLPTDTMKNTVYAIARERPITSIEEFARRLAGHFLKRVAALKTVSIEIHQTPWAHIGKHGSAFVREGTESRMTALTATHSQEELVSGLRNLEILKTGNSAFTGYMKDEFTTLPETRDRLLGTVLDADWTYRTGAQRAWMRTAKQQKELASSSGGTLDTAPVLRDSLGEIGFNDCHAGIRKVLLDSFANHNSESVQHTLFAMAQAALKEFSVIKSVHLVMPNRHRLLVDLSKFGLDNPNQIFVPTAEPSGYIEARVDAE